MHAISEEAILIIRRLHIAISQVATTLSDRLGVTRMLTKVGGDIQDTNKLRQHQRKTMPQADPKNWMMDEESFTPPLPSIAAAAAAMPPPAARGVGFEEDPTTIAAEAARPSSMSASMLDFVSSAADVPRIGQQETMYVDEPTQFDVLLGRGIFFQKHHGNRRLHKIMEHFKDRYCHGSRRDKTLISEEIVDRIQNCGEYSGRFLKKDPTADAWFVVPDAVARLKVSHAIRDNFRNGKWVDPRLTGAAAGGRGADIGVAQREHSGADGDVTRRKNNLKPPPSYSTSSSQPDSGNHLQKDSFFLDVDDESAVTSGKDDGDGIPFFKKKRSPHRRKKKKPDEDRNVDDYSEALNSKKVASVPEKTINEQQPKKAASPHEPAAGTQSLPAPPQLAPNKSSLLQKHLQPPPQPQPHRMIGIPNMHALGSVVATTNGTMYGTYVNQLLVSQILQRQLLLQQQQSSLVQPPPQQHQPLSTRSQPPRPSPLDQQLQYGKHRGDKGVKDYAPIQGSSTTGEQNHKSEEEDQRGQQQQPQEPPHHVREEHHLTHNVIGHVFNLEDLPQDFLLNTSEFFVTYVHKVREVANQTNKGGENIHGEDNNRDDDEDEEEEDGSSDSSSSDDDDVDVEESDGEEEDVVSGGN